MTEYEYEYCSVFQKWPNTNIIWFPKKWPNTNTNIIRFPNNDRIRLLFGYPEMTKYEYEYHSASKKLPNTNMNIRIPNYLLTSALIPTSRSQILWSKSLHCIIQIASLKIQKFNETFWQGIPSSCGFLPKSWRAQTPQTGIKRITYSTITVVRMMLKMLIIGMWQ